MNSSRFPEPVIEPNRPIIDAHHHLWFLPSAAVEISADHLSVVDRALAPTLKQHSRYLIDEYVADIGSGHNVRGSIFVDAAAMYRADGPPPMRSVGEVEFVNGIAAMSASGLYGDARICAGIVGGIDLRLGDDVAEVLCAQQRAGGDRYRGVRGSELLYDADSSILGPGVGSPNELCDAKFRSGFKWVERFGLSFDALILEPQLADLIDLAQSFPDTRIILNHAGLPVGVGQYAGKRQERFSLWRGKILELAKCQNVFVKLGGFGTPFGGFDSFRASPPATSKQLAQEWKPYIETCIEAFGAGRCMFESNFPIDSAVADFRTLWNAFKRVASGASEEEKDALFSGTARRVYRLLI